MSIPSKLDFCLYCGQNHNGLKCPQVKSIEYNEDGVTVKTVTFFSPSEMYIPIYPMYPNKLGSPWETPFGPPITWGTTISRASNDNNED